MIVAHAGRIEWNPTAQRFDGWIAGAGTANPHPLAADPAEAKAEFADLHRVYAADINGWWRRSYRFLAVDGQPGAWIVQTGGNRHERHNA